MLFGVMQMAHASKMYEQLLGINNSRQRVGFVGGSGTAATSDFIYDDPSGAFKYVAALGYFNQPGELLTYPNGINTSGEISGTYCSRTQNFGVEFVDVGGVFRDLLAPLITYPPGINDLGRWPAPKYLRNRNQQRGQIVGYYVDMGGNVNGFLDVGYPLL